MTAISDMAERVLVTGADGAVARAVKNALDEAGVHDVQMPEGDDDAFFEDAARTEQFFADCRPVVAGPSTGLELRRMG